MGGLVNGTAFDNTFGIKPKTGSGSNLIALIVAIYEIGCFFGAVTTSFVGEPLGRRRSVFIVGQWRFRFREIGLRVLKGVVIMIIGALLQSTAYVSAHMIVARIVSGFGMGCINSTVPVMMAEFAPKATRGIFVCAQLSTLNFGIAMVSLLPLGSGSEAYTNFLGLLD